MDDVVTHPGSATASATAIEARPVRTHLRVNAKRTLAASKQEGRTCSSRCPTSRAICEEHSLGTLMLHNAVSENTELNSVVNISLSLIAGYGVARINPVQLKRLPAAAHSRHG